MERRPTKPTRRPSPPRVTSLNRRAVNNHNNSRNYNHNTVSSVSLNTRHDDRSGSHRLLRGGERTPASPSTSLMEDDTYQFKVSLEFTSLPSPTPLKQPTVPLSNKKDNDIDRQQHHSEEDDSNEKRKHEPDMQDLLDSLPFESLVDDTTHNERDHHNSNNPEDRNRNHDSYSSLPLGLGIDQVGSSSHLANAFHHPSNRDLQTSPPTRQSQLQSSIISNNQDALDPLPLVMLHPQRSMGSTTSNWDNKSMDDSVLLQAQHCMDEVTQRRRRRLPTFQEPTPPKPYHPSKGTNTIQLPPVVTNPVQALERFQTFVMGTNNSRKPRAHVQDAVLVPYNSSTSQQQQQQQQQLPLRPLSDQYHVLQCPPCRAYLQVHKSAILYHCPTCPPNSRPHLNVTTTRTTTASSSSSSTQQEV